MLKIETSTCFYATPSDKHRWQCDKGHRWIINIILLVFIFIFSRSGLQQQSGRCSAEPLEYFTPRTNNKLDLATSLRNGEGYCNNLGL